jgi:hypothetical protein
LEAVAGHAYYVKASLRGNGPYMELIPNEKGKIEIAKYMQMPE